MTLAELRQQGIEPICFADNNAGKITHEGLPVLYPELAQSIYPDAQWMVTIYTGAARAVRQQLREMGVKMTPLRTFENFDTTIPESLYALITEQTTLFHLYDQKDFRSGRLNYDQQRLPDDIANLYFPGFIRKIENEVFVDCGACDGDTIDMFLGWQPHPKFVYTIEPDPANFRKLEYHYGAPFLLAVSDQSGWVKFSANGSTDSKVSETGNREVFAIRLDDFFAETTGRDQPTFIKMDIEGHELEALWGARKILKEHMPVLAICAYHEPDHLWEIPLLIHAIQPNYELRFRRYAEGTRELVWYALPKERIA